MPSSLNPLRGYIAGLALLVLLSVSWGQSVPVKQAKESSEASSPRGMIREDDSTSAGRYREQWAVVIGIDYKDSSMRALRNAENDAQSVHDMLIKHYGYKSTNIQLLLGSKATREAIRGSLGGKFLGDKSRIQESDGVLVFFAGHGHRLSVLNKHVGVISPFDVRIQDGNPIYDSTLRYHEDIVQLLNLCPARHKLLILNCCHSGEVFSERFPQSAVDDRRAGTLFRMSALQALASCRANEVDDDGKGNNSPFTTSLTHALQLLPNQKERKDYFTATEMFLFMRNDLAWRRPEDQSPDLRSLIDQDGEFRFFPNQETDFAQYCQKDINIRLLRAMVPGEYGNWWFDENPWFIPSLRKEILIQTDQKRGLYADAIRRKELLRATEKVMKRLQARTDGLSKRRLRQLVALLHPEKSRDFRKLREELIAALESQQDLEATDFHLLAVLQHSLGLEDADKTYVKALEKYQEERQNLFDADPQRKAARQRDNQALEALCYADYGYYKFDVLNECERAAELYHESRGLCGPQESPPPFQIFVLCREADAWQRLGRWGMSKDRLDQALHIARQIDPELKSSLTAHTLNRRGWACMEQWKFGQAEKEFETSNQILHNLLDDPNALLLWFHNRHGLAMARRFRGEPQQAATEYRTMLNELGKKFQDVRENAKYNQDGSEVKARLVERWSNSMERLADCNLFADPDKQDLREASDDLRRTLRYCYILPANQRNVTEAGLLYKQAIVLSLRSPAQDIPLAVSYCRRAEKLAESLVGNQGSLLDCQRKLTPPIVDLFQTCADKPDCLENKRAALAKLRGAVQELREKWKNNDHRDFLEFLLFANKILVEEAIDADRYESLMDSEMLLGFCRRALRGDSRDPMRYLRPYYDTVMAAKLRLKPRHAKELLEVQWEATQGKSFRKEGQRLPVLALYQLKDKLYLLIDIPGPQGASHYYCLQDDYSPEEIHMAIRAGNAQLELPRKVVRELQEIPSAPATERKVQCWFDGAAGSPSIHTVGLRGESRLQFPFKLPPGFKSLLPGPASSARVTVNP